MPDNEWCDKSGNITPANTPWRYGDITKDDKTWDSWESVGDFANKVIMTWELQQQFNNIVDIDNAEEDLEDDLGEGQNQDHNETMVENDFLSVRNKKPEESAL